MRPPFRLALAVAALLFVYLYGLSRTGLIGPDEPRYAAIGREMARSGDWITPRLWGEVWLEKPALLYWLVAIGNTARLGPELAPRVPVALFSAAFLVFFFLRVRREFGARPAAYSSSMLATSAGWVAFSHVAVTDLLLAATFGASLLLVLPWIRSGGRRGLLPAGALLGLAVLAKGLVPLVLAVPILWFARRRLLDLTVFAAATLAVAAPWYIACWLANGQVFIDEFLIRHHFGRFVSTELQHVQPWWFYVPVLLGLLFPWTPALAALRRVAWREPRQQLLAATVLFGFVFFSASTNKLPGYVLPLLPPVFILIGVHLPAFERRWVVPLAAAVLGITPVVSATLPDALVLGLSRAPIQGFSPWVFAGAALALAVTYVLERDRRRDTALGVAVALAAAALVYLKWDLYPRLDVTATARTEWANMAAGKVPACIDDHTRAIRYGLNYYAGRALPNCTGERHRTDGGNHGILDRK